MRRTSSSARNVGPPAAIGYHECGMDIARGAGRNSTGAHPICLRKKRREMVCSLRFLDGMPAESGRWSQTQCNNRNDDSTGERAGRFSQDKLGADLIFAALWFFGTREIVERVGRHLAESLAMHIHGSDRWIAVPSQTGIVESRD